MKMKRVYKKDLVRYDSVHDTSLERELEMYVDAVLIVTAYSPQFWTDAIIYGIKEALLYLKNYEPPVHNGINSPEMKKLEKTIAEIEQLFQ